MKQVLRKKVKNFKNLPKNWPERNWEKHEDFCSARRILPTSNASYVECTCWQRRENLLCVEAVTINGLILFLILTNCMLFSGSIKSPTTLKLVCFETLREELWKDEDRRDKRKCPRCGQVFEIRCVMCSGKEYEYLWREDDPEDRYTAFWKSHNADLAIKNAPHWNWDVFYQNQ